MTGYRGRTVKPAAALWAFVVLVDAGWAVTADTAAVLGTIAAVVLVALVLLGARAMLATSAPAREPARRRLQN